jgi:hypothetical protein
MSTDYSIGDRVMWDYATRMWRTPPLAGRGVARGTIVSLDEHCARVDFDDGFTDTCPIGRLLVKIIDIDCPECSKQFVIEEDYLCKECRKGRT